MPTKARILVVDDEKVVRESLRGLFTEDGYQVGAAADAKDALRKIQAEPWDLLLLDIKMPGMDGLELHKRAKEIVPEIVVIMMTAYASVDTAVQALIDGAYDYVTKPFDPDDLERLIDKALEHRELMRENVQLRERIEALAREQIDEVMGESPEMKGIRDQIRTVAETDATVLIQGESGTGKELVARAVHHASARAAMPMVVAHCARLPDGLIESELFGHEKGAFTGAEYRRKGKFELADGGTIFFDEVGDINAKTQVDLLRVLEEKSFTRLGGGQTVHTDFRVIAASNRDLQKEVDEDRFRLDLFYRLNVFTISLPPLRDRISDIAILAEHFLEKLADKMGRARCHLAEGALERLRAYDWPGNVRELENVIERAVIVQKGTEILPGDLSIQAQETQVPRRGALAMAEVERQHIQMVLDRMEGNISRAAQALEIDRVTLYSKIKKYGLKRQG